MKNSIILALAATAVIGGSAVAWLEAAAPQIDAVAATPAYIVINTPTAVTFTARITDPTVQPGVTLLKTDAAGKTLSTVGTMNDTGLNGDLVAGDKTFSLDVTINQTVLGQLHYRVSAPFKGVLQRSLSRVLPITIDPVALPPDPEEAGKQTLQGVDSDHDGVRDDIQRYIVLNYRSDPKVLNAMLQLAGTLQSLITAPTDATPSTLTVLAQSHDRALECTQFVVGGAVNALQKLRDLRAVVVNTKQRSLSYVATDSKFSGIFFPPTDPRTYHASCESR